MPAYQTPGVYYERVDAGPPTVMAFRTDIAGFVGLAPRGPVDLPIPVQSWRQFVAFFGDVAGTGFLAYAVRAFFENGGRKCYVVRVASSEPNGGHAAASVTLRGLDSGEDLWRIAASSPGAWGNTLAVTLRETHRLQTRARPRPADPAASEVDSTGGFQRGTLVRLTQEARRLWRVVSDVDPIDSRLVWVHPDPASRLSYDRPLPFGGPAGFQPDMPIEVESVEYTMIVWQDGIPIAQYERLALVPEHPRYGPALLGAILPTMTADGLPAAPQPVVVEDMRDLEALRVARQVPVEPLDAPETPLPLDGGADGLALLTARDFIGEDLDPLDDDAVQARKRRGLRALELIEEVAILAVPDIQVQPVAVPAKAPPPPCIPDICLPPVFSRPVPRPQPQPELPPRFSEQDIYRVQEAQVQQCEALRDRFALLDPPWSAARDGTLGLNAAQIWRSRFDSQYAAFYFPWIRVVDPLRSAGSPTRSIPPCGHVAGQYARTDNEAGVHRAPANAPLDWAQDVTLSIGDEAQGILNPAGINAVRAFPGRGLRLFGARTVSSDPDWRYVNVRRLMMRIEKALLFSLQWAVFEPNDELTRIHIRLAITGFLLSLWQQGALAGSTMQEAFYVQCDEENNPPRERDRGRLLAEVGVAPAQPFEFVVLRVGRAHNAFEIVDGAARAGVR